METGKPEYFSNITTRYRAGAARTARAPGTPRTPGCDREASDRGLPLSAERYICLFVPVCFPDQELGNRETDHIGGEQVERAPGSDNYDREHRPEGNEEKVKQVVKAAKDYGIPIRVGVNLGSLERDLFDKYGYSAEAMVESAMRHIKILEDLDFYDTIVSLKASDVTRMVEAYRLFAEKTDYPLHLGVTEAGSKIPGTVKSAMGIGMLLHEGIGDTIRISLSEDPKEEVRVGKHILRALGLRNEGVQVTSCPTCARTNVDVIKLVEQLESATEKIKKPIKVAVMGCSVNGPGESRKADIGIVGAPGNHLLYKDGKIVKRINDNEIYEVLLKEIKEMEKNGN